MNKTFRPHSVRPDRSALHGLLLSLLFAFGSGCVDGEPVDADASLVQHSDASVQDAAEQTEAAPPPVDAGAPDALPPENCDQDEDGHRSKECGGTDCDDNNGEINTQAAEVCDDAGVDEDCKPETFVWRDEDKDGYPDEKCANFTESGNRYCGKTLCDCDDHDPQRHPKTLCYADGDGDGHGDQDAVPIESCHLPVGYSWVHDDHDDEDPASYHEAPEICDGKDNDGDTEVDEEGEVKKYIELTATNVECIPEIEGEPAHLVITECPEDRQWCPESVPCPDGEDWCRAQIEQGCRWYATRLSSCRACKTDCHFSCGQKLGDGLDNGDGRNGSNELDEPDGCDEVEEIVSSAYQTCARTEQGRVACWGAGEDGRLGDGSTALHTSPAWVLGITEANGLALGSAHGCAVVGQDRTLWCWGANGRGQLSSVGAGAFQPVPTPAQFYTGLPVTQVLQIAAGPAHSCLVTQGNELFCFGWTEDGRLGHGVLDGAEGAVPTRADPVLQLEYNELFDEYLETPVRDVVEVAVGSAHSCARLGDGTVGCWGANEHGQLGNGSTDPSPFFSRVEGLASVERLRAGGLNTCAISFGEAYCWGSNGALQVGLSENEPYSASPVKVAGLPPIEDLAVGASTVCVRATDGRVACLGSTEVYGAIIAMPGGGVVPTNTREPLWLPVETDRLSPSIGSVHHCVLAKGGMPTCWGRNTHGQLGDGNLSPSRANKPVVVEHVASELP